MKGATVADLQNKAHACEGTFSTMLWI